MWKVLLHAAQQNPPMEILHEAKDLLLADKTAVLASTAERQGERMLLFPVWALTPTSLLTPINVSEPSNASECGCDPTCSKSHLPQWKPPLASSGHSDSQKPCRRVCGARIYRCTLVSKPYVQRSLLLQADTWKKIQFSSLKTNSDNQLVKLRL